MAYDDHVEGVHQAQMDPEERARTFKATINRIRATVEPPHDLFCVEMTHEQGLWRETLGSEADLEIFLKGLVAGAGMMDGRIEFGEIPQEAKLL